MGKKQRERKRLKEQQKRPGAVPPTWASGEISPEGRKIMDQLGRGELFRSEEQLFELVTDSAVLRDEPEFDDFAFDAEEVIQRTNPPITAQQKRLEEARKVSDDEYYAVYDEVRLQAIDALLTKERRKEFLRRYDAMLRRLLEGTDTDRIATALVTRSIFDQHSMPWGMAGILIELYEEARERIVDRIESIDEIIIESLKKQHPEMTEEERQAILNDPERLDQVIPTIDPSLEQMALLEEMTGEIMDSFETSLYGGAVPLDLFREDELEELARRLNAVAAKANVERGELERANLEAFGHVLQHYISEVVTDQRQTALANDLDEIIREWQQSGNQQSLLLEMERNSLQEVEPAENQFIYAALVGQLRRAGGEMEGSETGTTARTIDSTVVTSSIVDE